MRAASALGVTGVFLNLIVPGQAFEIVLNLAGLGMVAVWSSIIVFLVLVIHGTDTMAYTAAFAAFATADLTVPVIFTGISCPRAATAASISAATRSARPSPKRAWPRTCRES